MAIDPLQLGADNELGRRYITDFPRVESFYACDYRRPEHLASHASKLINRTWRKRFDRGRTVALLQAYARRQPTPQAALDNIERIRDPNCVCVLTGQQSGLGGGPLLVLYKALTAVRLANDLERASGQPCVPVFWNASDDSDVEEVNRLRGLGPGGELLKFRFDIPAGKRHVRDITLPGADHPDWQRAEQTLGAGPFRDRAAELLLDAAGRDFGSAFTRLLNELAGARGLVVIEPWALAAHPAWRRVHAFEIEQREENRLGLQRLYERLESLGLPPGVPISNHLNLFKTINGERRHLSCEGRRLVIEGVSRHDSMTAVLADLRDDPARFTPNVLLRPLIQNAIFPTVAYVGGQAEIAYHALLKGLHRGAQVFMPALFPRLTMTLVEGDDARRFDKLVAFRKGLKWRQKEATIVHEEAQAGLRRAFHDLRENLVALARPLEQDLQKFEQRTLRAASDVMTRVKHDPLSISEGGAEMQPLLNRYFPEDRPQERAITLLAAYAAHGPRLVDAIDGIAEIFDFHHHVAVL